jgi:hypothetical protein
MEVSARSATLVSRRGDAESPIAFDDPVPADSGIFRDVAPSRAHSIERQVQRKLLASPGLHFSSLVVRRMPDGICLEGVLTASDGSDVCSVAQQVEGVTRVLNHLLVPGRDVGQSLLAVH